jgi:hypothetical protein
MTDNSSNDDDKVGFRWPGGQGEPKRAAVMGAKR